MSHMTTVQSAATEIGLRHQVVYDIYDLYDYVKEEKLNYFTVSMLKEILLSSSSHLHLDIQSFSNVKNKGNDP